MKQEYVKVTVFFKTADLALATTISLWYPLDCIERTSNSKVIFLFKKDKPLDELVQAYWRKELEVEPQAFFTQLKFLKTRIYEERSQ